MTTASDDRFSERYEVRTWFRLSKMEREERRTWSIATETEAREYEQSVRRQLGTAIDNGIAAVYVVRITEEVLEEEKEPADVEF